ncbi:VF530 family protein [Bacteriovoracaceae bacterium]|nr:VF530 family protein [Bacteriovoracaceae bacterium]
MNKHPNNPLQGLTLESIITKIVDTYSFDELASQFNFRCFTHDPSIKSTLKFLRKTPWARTKIEKFYIEKFCKAIS